jgi:hypothetical protein
LKSISDFIFLNYVVTQFYLKGSSPLVEVEAEDLLGVVQIGYISSDDKLFRRLACVVVPSLNELLEPGSAITE